MLTLETGLAFIEGLALIVSPCILPVLPLILGASVDGGRARPFGIIIGFVLAFSLFAMGARYIVSALGVDLDLIKDASLVLLFAFGLILLSESLSARFTRLTQGAANMGIHVASSAQGGLLSGIAIGALIGLVWTPCAGPILASVLVQVIRQETDIESMGVVVAFALGASVPMFIIAMTGRKIMHKLSFFTRNAETMRKGFGALIIASVLFIATGGNASALFMNDDAVQPAPATQGLIDGLATPYAAPGIAGIEAWLNSDPLTLESLKGKVVLIDFWTYSCINCVRTLPYVTKWDTTYRDKGLVIIGVHAPEFAFERKVSNVAAALKQHNIRYPVAIDNRLDTWTNFKNRYWPAHYLIDKEGKVVYTHFGEGKYDVMEHNIRHLLGIGGEAMKEDVAPPAYASGQTPETYLGTARAKLFAGTPALANDSTARYTLPAFLPLNHWGLSGGWKTAAQHITSTEKGAAIQLNFQAKHVYLVLGTATGTPITASVALNGTPITSGAGKDITQSTVTVGQHTLYHLVTLDDAANAQLTLTANAAGLEAYAFTFGSR